jgi:nucleoside 2-deoxyribosyltransferase
MLSYYVQQTEAANMARLVYVAGPLFSEAERAFLERMVSLLASASRLDAKEDFFLPHRDGGELGKGPSRLEIFNLDQKTLADAGIVVALLDGQDVDSGTCIELGYAYAKGKKIFGIITDFRSYHTKDDEPHRPNLMVWGVCEQGDTLFHNLEELSSAFVAHIEKQYTTKVMNSTAKR